MDFTTSIRFGVVLRVAIWYKLAKERWGLNPTEH